MGFKSIFNGLVPTRFLCLIAHMVIIITIFIRRDESVKSCENYKADRDLLDMRFIVALSFSLGFLVIELISFMVGISLFNSLQCALSTMFHASAAIALSCMVLYQWCSLDYWPVFAINSCLPIICEFFVIIGVWIFKRPIS